MTWSFYTHVCLCVVSVGFKKTEGRKGMEEKREMKKIIIKTRQCLTLRLIQMQLQNLVWRLNITKCFPWGILIPFMSRFSLLISSLALSFSVFLLSFFPRELQIQIDRGLPQSEKIPSSHTGHLNTYTLLWFLSLRNCRNNNGKIYHSSIDKENSFIWLPKTTRDAIGWQLSCREHCCCVHLRDLLRSPGGRTAGWGSSQGRGWFGLVLWACSSSHILSLCSQPSHVPTFHCWLQLPPPFNQFEISISTSFLHSAHSSLPWGDLLE